MSQIGQDQIGRQVEINLEEYDLITKQLEQETRFWLFEIDWSDTLWFFVLIISFFQSQSSLKTWKRCNAQTNGRLEQVIEVMERENLELKLENAILKYICAEHNLT